VDRNARAGEVRERLAGARLYVVTGARQEQGDLPPFLEAILAAGTDIVQLREKQAEAGDLMRWAAEFRRAASRHGALFVVNDRPDVALAVGADGVHVGQNDLPVGFVRELVGPEMLIGLSTHDRTQVLAAAPPADYVCVGPVHATPTKPGRPATGLDLVRAAAATERRPWFAIGGIDRRTLPDVLGAGAARIVVVRAVTEAADPGGAARALRRMLDRACGS
jgi:thiamine-phosphate pyrophosphorylase